MDGSAVLHHTGTGIAVLHAFIHTILENSVGGLYRPWLESRSELAVRGDIVGFMLGCSRMCWTVALTSRESKRISFSNLQ